MAIISIDVLSNLNWIYLDKLGNARIFLGLCEFYWKE
ncbi:hypothetical protein SAMN03080594_104283 [Arenibacter palladensis]|uniref:Uncharacterized protein n=1 Tax=Arenibacter palladensis TaxID=237373 RepID=A0A1M5BYX7_9FLAO|nr:hypothetical protein SAMN03080594_104283 [Arenibacter palladensis]